MLPYISAHRASRIAPKSSHLYSVARALRTGREMRRRIENIRQSDFKSVSNSLDFRNLIPLIIFQSYLYPDMASRF
jgi:hypothetical protein